MPLKQIQNLTLFAVIQTSTMTFIAYLMRFCLILQPLKNPHRILTGPCGFISVGHDLNQLFINHDLNHFM